MRRSAVSASMIELPNFVEHPVLLRAREVLVNGEADHFPRMAVGHREPPGRVAQMLQAFLLIERNRIVDFGFDAVVEAVFVEFVAPLSEDHVEMIDVLHVLSTRRHAYA